MAAMAGLTHPRLHSLPACMPIVLFASLALTPELFAQRYSVTVLPLPEGYEIAYPHGLNNSGVMCGWAFGEPNRNAAVLWRGNRVITLPQLVPEGRPNAWASGINAQGIVVGRSDGLLGVWQAVMWPDEKTVLPLLNRKSAAYGTNDSLVVIGDYSVGFLEVNAFLWEKGEWFSLYPPMEFGQHVNNHKQALGGTARQSWLWDKGVFYELPGLDPGDYWVRASSINDHARLAGGIIRTPESNALPVIWTDLVPREMPVVHPGLGGGIGQVNLSGLALGASYNRSQTDYKPTLWAGHLAMDLNELIVDRDARSWRVNTPWCINDVGQIAAIVQSFGQTYGWSVARLDPIDTGLTLWGMEPSRPGRRNVIQVNHATPGGRVSLLWGVQRGEPTPMNHCNGAMIDIVDPRLAATAVAGPDGRAIFNVFIPANVLGLYVLQAVDHRTCEVSPPAWALLKTEN